MEEAEAKAHELVALMGQYERTKKTIGKVEQRKVEAEQKKEELRIRMEKMSDDYAMPVIFDEKGELRKEYIREYIREKRWTRRLNQKGVLLQQLIFAAWFFLPASVFCLSFFWVILSASTKAPGWENVTQDDVVFYGTAMVFIWGLFWAFSLILMWAWFRSDWFVKRFSYYKAQ